MDSSPVGGSAKSSPAEALLKFGLIAQSLEANPDDEEDEITPVSTNNVSSVTPKNELAESGAVSGETSKTPSVMSLNLSLTPPPDSADTSNANSARKSQRKTITETKAILAQKNASNDQRDRIG
jgi:hypothetical protein